MQAFEINVPDEVLVDLRKRLAHTRYPDQLEGAQWEYGTELQYLRSLCRYWETEYDWRAQEQRLNRLPQFKTTVNGLELHFIHVRSKHEAAKPLLLAHGWPGSFAEFSKVIGPLTDPCAHGGDAKDAFHVVVPSMPGYGFSQAPRKPGFDIVEVARTYAALMSELGYRRYGVQGGDWGALVCRNLCHLCPEQVSGIHLNLIVALPPKSSPNPMEGVLPEELAALAGLPKFQQEELGYQQIQGTKPQSLGYALNDSPVGLCAWIIEKFRAWSDCDNDVERRFTKDELLTNVMIYWVTRSITSSMRLYCESIRSGSANELSQRIDTPMAAAIFPRETYQPPRAWAAPVFNIQRWTRMKAGGHFAAMEEPTALVEDIRAFFRMVT